MADGEVKHASIGLDLNINGLAEFRKADEMTTQFVERMRGVNSTVNDLRDKFGGLGSSIARDLSKPTDSVKKLHNEINELSRGTNKVGKFNVATPTTHQVDSMHKLVTEYRSLGNTKLGSVKNDFNEVNKKTDEGSEKMKHYGSSVSGTTKKMHGLRDMFWGSFAGNALSNAFSDIVTGAENAVKEGMKLSAAGARIKKQWQDIGLSSQGATSMINQIADIRGKSNFAGTAIDSMQKKFYTLTNSASKARALTNEMSAFGAEAGKSGDQVAQMANTLGRSLSGKNVSAGFFNRAFGSMPELRKQVIQASGMTNEAFTNALKNSKITGNQLEGYMLKAAKGSGKAWEQYLKTPQGKIAELQGSYTNLKSVFAKPVVSGLTKALDGAAKKNGGLDKTKKSVTEIVTKLGQATGKGLEGVINFIVKNHDSLAKSGHAMGSITKNLAIGIWSPFGKIFSVISGDSGKAGKGMKVFADGLNDISKHKKAVQDVGKAIAGIFAINMGKKGFDWTKSIMGSSKQGGLIFRPKVNTKGAEKELTTFAKLARHPIQTVVGGFTGLRQKLLDANGAFKIINTTMKANVFIAVAGAVLAIGAALYELYKHNKKFRKFVNGIARGAKKELGKAGKEFGKLASAAGKQISKMAKNVGKRYGNMWGDTKKLSKNGIRTLKSGLKVFGDVYHGRWNRIGKDTKKLVSNMWKTWKSYFKEGYDWINDLSGGRLGKLLKITRNAFKDIGKDWHSFWNGIDDWFGGIWKSIGKHAADGINTIIRVLNGGISGIDAVIHAFGGKSSAIGKIGYVHFATGTGAISGRRRAITKPTMAVLNDGHDSPETKNREMLIHPNGVSELIKGTNVKRMLEPGAEVLNASETKFALGMKHFAKGTGLFGSIENIASGVANGVSSGVKGLGNFASKAWHGATHLLSTLQKLISSPAKTVSGMFGKGGPKEAGSIMNDFSSGMFKATKNGATGWWKQLMSEVGNVLHSDSGGDASGLVAAMEKYGHGHKYVWGATGPDTFDCSGLVMYALKHAFGINYPHFSGSQYSKSEHISKGEAKPGDLVFFGSGGDEHVGVYAGHGDYYSALNPNRHPNIGMSPVSTGPGAAHFARVAGLSQKAGGDKKKSSNKGAYSRFNAQTGGMLSWIKKHLAPLLDTDSYGSDKVMGGAITHSMIAKALEIAHVPHKYWSKMQHDIIAVADSETGNQNEMQKIHDINTANGNPAGGPLQFTKSTFDAFAFPGHHDWRSSLDQVLAYLNNTQYLHAAGQTTIWGHSKFDWLHSGPQGGKRYRKNGGPVKANEPYIVGEKGWEVFNPDANGKIIPHDQSVDLVANHSAKSDRPVSIDARTTIKVEGNLDDKILDKVQKMMEKNNDDKVDKIRGVLGLDDEWGLNS